MSHDKSRRTFLKGLAAGAALPTLAGARACGDAAGRPVVTCVRNACTVISPRVKEPVKFFLVGDTHLTANDARGDAYLQYTKRMGGEQHESAGEKASFRETLAAAKAARADLVALVGDQISFPSPAGVDFLRQELDAAGVPWLYTSGNHDWHYEGEEGAEVALRAVHEPEILGPLYPAGANPLCYTRVVKGVRFVAIDDSTNTILPEQLAYWRREVATGEPLVLLMHIPLYIPGYTVGEGPVGHPDWGAKSDPYYRIERRPRWPEEGPDATTRAFRDEVFAAPNLLGVFTGHTHRLQVGFAETGAAQVVCEANRKDAARVEVTLLPAPRPEPPPRVLPPPAYCSATEDWRDAFRRVGFDPEAPGSSYFIVTSDVHAPTQDVNLKAHVDFWNTMEPAPAFVTVLGDLGWVNQYFGHRPSPEEAAAKAAESFGAINAAVTNRLRKDVPHVYVVGNHDTYPGEGDRKLWRTHFPDQPPYAAYDFCGIRFLKWDGGGDGMFSAEQEAWIRRECAACPKDKAIVVLVHQPSVGSTARELDVGRVAKSALADRPGVTWLLAGHEHANAEALWDLPGGGRLMVATHVRDIDGWWAYGVRDGQIVARLFKPELKTVYESGTMPGDLTSRGEIPLAFQGRDAEVIWKAFVGSPEERACRVSIGKTGDNGGGFFYIDKLRYRFPKADLAPAATRLAILGRLFGSVKTKEPPRLYLSADGETWIEVARARLDNSLNEYPIPEALVGARDLHLRYDSFGFGGNDALAAFAFLR